tara:strand:+ start:870 stop:2537 length:1668 start_codon:yes stop_codon:yes gene_type:complete
MTAAQRAVAQGQPMKAQTGASVNLNGSISNQLMAIQQLRGMGDRATLNNIATDKRLPRSVQMAAANALAGIEAQPDEPSQQVPLAPLDKQGSLASGTPVMAVRGSGAQIPVGSKDAGLQDDPSLASGPVAVSSIPEGGVGSLTEAQVDPMTRIGSSMSTDMLNRIRKARGLEPISDTVSDSLVGAARSAVPEGTLTPAKIAATQAETASLVKSDAKPSEFGDGPLGEFEGIGPQNTGPSVLQDDPALADKKEDKTPDAGAAAEKIATDPSTLLPQISTTLGDEKKTNKQKADATDAALGIKGTRKERIEQRYEMLKDFLGEDKADDIRTDVGYNLMMTGLMIAAGQSPDAMTNIAGGLAKGLAGYGKAAGEAAQEARKEDRALKIMAIKEDADREAREAEAKAAKEIEELKQAEATKRAEIAASAPSETVKTIQALQGSPELMAAYQEMQAAKTGDALEKARRKMIEKMIGADPLVLRSLGVVTDGVVDNDLVRAKVDGLLGLTTAPAAPAAVSGLSLSNFSAEEQAKITAAGGFKSGSTNYILDPETGVLTPQQ